jgi:GDP-D-mannose dehydratase
MDLIYHLGEYSRVEQSLQEPAVVWDLNIAGTFRCLGILARTRKCKLVYAGSSTKFGDGGLARMATPYAGPKPSNTELVTKLQPLVRTSVCYYVFLQRLRSRVSVSVNTARSLRFLWTAFAKERLCK